MSAGHGFKIATARATSPGGGAEPVGYYTPSPSACTHDGWSDERVERLKALYGEGLSASQIAKKLGGVTRNAVIGKVNRLGIKRDRPSRPERVARVSRPRTPPAERNTGGARKLASILAKHEPAPEPIVEDISNARPWLTRKFGECAFPVSGEGADTLSCCAPSGDANYCAAHRLRMVAKPDARRPKTANELARSLRRYVA